MEKSKRYCEPWNAGLASSTPAVNRRLARLLDALGNEINSNVARGPIVEDIRALSVKIREGLEADGYFLTYDGGDRLKVYDPESRTGKAKRADMERRLAR